MRNISTVFSTQLEATPRAPVTRVLAVPKNGKRAIHSFAPHGALIEAPPQLKRPSGNPPGTKAWLAARCAFASTIGKHVPGQTRQRRLVNACPPDIGINTHQHNNMESETT